MRITAIIYWLLLSFSTTLSGNNESPIVLTTNAVIADMAQNIGGNLVTVVSITPNGRLPQKMVDTSLIYPQWKQAKLILTNELGIESKLAQQIKTQLPTIPYFDLAEQIQPHPDHPALSAAWMNPQHGKLYLTAIQEALSLLLPLDKEAFAFNTELYLQQLNDTEKHLNNLLIHLSTPKPPILTYYPVMAYFGDAYQISTHALIPLTSEEVVQPDALQLWVAEQGFPIVFATAVDPKNIFMDRTLPNDYAVGGKLYVYGFPTNNPMPSTYLDLLEYNAQIIAKGLSIKPTEKNNDPSRVVNALMSWGWVIFIALGLLWSWRKLAVFT